MDASTALGKNTKALARAATTGLAGAIAANEGRFLLRRHGADVLRAFGL